MKDEQRAYEDRRWFLHRTTGDRGYLIARDGQRYIRYDRGEHSPEVPYDEQRWQEEAEPERSLNEIQIAGILYAADAALCAALGGHPKARVPFMALAHEERQRWFRKPPGGRKIRTRLWAYTKKAMETAFSG